jgi:nucleoside-diphosphate-sugar epimerase
MVMTDESWHVVRNIRGVTGFVGPGSRPVPLTDEEAAAIIRDDVTVSTVSALAVGDMVDIVEGIFRVMQGAPQAGEEGRKAPFSVYNIGNSDKVGLFDFVRTLCEELKRAGALDEDFDLDAHIRLEPLQPGDVPVTYADTEALERDLGFKPKTPLRVGLRAFAKWYKSFYIDEK